MLLQASKGHRIGQSCVKLIFDVADVAGFKKAQAKLGLKFGSIHHGPNYVFSNARDPAKNLIQISSGFLIDKENGLLDLAGAVPGPQRPAARPELCPEDRREPFRTRSRDRQSPRRLA